MKSQWNQNLKFDYRVLLVMLRVKFDTSKDGIASEVTIFDGNRNYLHPRVIFQVNQHLKS